MNVSVTLLVTSIKNSMFTKDMAHKIKNVLFDFDGTLFDTQRLHSQVESELLGMHGIVLTPEEITKTYSGVRTEEFFADLLGSRELADAVVKKKREILFGRCGEAEEMADLDQLFSFLRSKDILFGVGTASPQKWVDTILQEKGLFHFFDRRSIVAGDMVTKGKPDPETWLKLQRNVPAGECLVVEDGVSGSVAAVACGMHCAVLGQPDAKFPDGVIFISSLDLIPGMFPV